MAVYYIICLCCMNKSCAKYEQIQVKKDLYWVTISGACIICCISDKNGQA